MKESWVCRDYESGDEHKILGLFAQVIQREMSLDFWRWRFLEGPFGKGIIKLLFDGDKLIGHYAVIPMDVQVQDKLLKAVLSVTTMTHPDYSGQGIFTFLAEETYKFCQERGFKFVFGFPNRNSYPGFVRKLKWQDLGKMTLLEKRLQPMTERRPARTRFSVKETKRFESTLNLLWDKVKRDYMVIVPRTEQFLNWRFVQSPDTKYTKYIALDKYDTISGYIVLKIYAQEDMMRGHIVDMLSITEEKVVDLLLEYSYDYFFEKGIRDIFCWMPRDSFYEDILKEEGFVRKETDTYFGVRVFNENNLSVKGVEQLSNWFITMGDSDVF